MHTIQRGGSKLSLEYEIATDGGTTYGASCQRNHTVVTSLTDHRQSSTQGTDQTAQTIAHNSSLYTTIEFSSIDIDTRQFSSCENIWHATDGFADKHDHQG